MKAICRAIIDAAYEAFIADPDEVNFSPRQRRSLRWLALSARPVETSRSSRKEQ